MNFKILQFQLILFSIIGIILLYVYKANIFFICICLFFIIFLYCVIFSIRELTVINNNVYIENIFSKKHYCINDIMKIDKLFINFYKITVEDKIYFCYGNIDY